MMVKVCKLGLGNPKKGCWFLAFVIDRLSQYAAEWAPWAANGFFLLQMTVGCSLSAACLLSLAALTSAVYRGCWNTSDLDDSLKFQFTAGFASVGLPSASSCRDSCNLFNMAFAGSFTITNRRVFSHRTLSLCISGIMLTVISLCRVVACRV